MSTSIKEFFDKHIIPVHQAGEKNLNHFLDLETDQSKESYFTTPIHPQFHNLNTIEIDSETGLREYLFEFWKDKPELLAMIPDLVKLAFSLKGSGKEVQPELSPFVYAMY